MAEVLTESFCERCGTRYTFESARTRGKRLKGVKVLSRGLKNFVLSDDSSLDEAMAAARSDTEHEVTSQQLDAFHKTFNFCMTCRQYTCANCWNEAEGTCLTCSPHLGREIMPAPFPDLDPALGMTVEMGATGIANGNANGNGIAAANDGNGHVASTLDTGAWPTSDLPQVDDDQHGSTADMGEIDVAARMAALTAIGTSQTTPAELAPVEPPPVEMTVLEPETIVEDMIEVAAEIADPPVEVPSPTPPTPAVLPPAEQAASDDVAAVATAQTAALLQRFRPGQSLDAEIEAYERELAATGSAAVSAVEPVATAEPDPEQAAEAAAAAMVLAAGRPTDVVAQPTWRIVAPDVEPIAPVVVPPAPAPIGPPAATAAPRPEWPAQPEWPSQRPAAGLPFFGRLTGSAGGLESLWAESNREVASAAPTTERPAQGGVQPCLSCGLSLSATARFCRRCGTSQAG